MVINCSTKSNTWPLQETEQGHYEETVWLSRWDEKAGMQIECTAMCSETSNDHTFNEQLADLKCDDKELDTPGSIVNSSATEPMPG